MPPPIFPPTEPLPLHHSWALLDRARRFEEGGLLDRHDFASVPRLPPLAARPEWAREGVGVWECALPADTLCWSAEVHAIFGIPRTLTPYREAIVPLYCEESRAAMERLRAYAIRHRRGFTLDAQIRPAGGAPRWMRLIAAPVCEGERVVRLQGLKQLL